MIRQEIDELLHQQPFEPFVLRLTSGNHYEIRDIALVAMLKTGVFIAKPNPDRRVIVPFLHIAAVETTNGRNGRRTKRSS